MSDAAPQSFVGRMARLLVSLDIPYMITGSVASSMWGRPRATFDLDLVIDPTMAQVIELCESIGDTGYVNRQAAIDAVAARGMFNIIDYASGEKADLILRKESAFHRSEFARRVGRHTDEGELVFVSAEDSILSKLLWAKQSESERQLMDAAQMLHRLADTLDARYLDQWAEHLQVMPLLQRCRHSA